MPNGTNRSRDVRFIICVFANGQTLPIFVLFGVKDSAKGVGNTDCLVLVTRPFHLTFFHKVPGIGNFRAEGKTVISFKAMDSFRMLMVQTYTNYNRLKCFNLSIVIL